MWQIGNVHLGHMSLSGAIYVGRAAYNGYFRPHGALERQVIDLPQSPLANPYRLDPGKPRGEQRQVVDQYRRWLWAMMRAETPARRELERLAMLPGGILVCWCARELRDPADPAECHADVIARAVDWLRRVYGIVEIRPATSPDWRDTKVAARAD